IGKWRIANRYSANYSLLATRCSLRLLDREFALLDQLLIDGRLLAYAFRELRRRAAVDRKSEILEPRLDRGLLQCARELTMDPLDVGGSHASRPREAPPVAQHEFGRAGLFRRGNIGQSLQTRRRSHRQTFELAGFDLGFTDRQRRQVDLHLASQQRRDGGGAA